MEKNTQPTFHVEGPRLIISGLEFKNYEIFSKIGEGVNGIVYHAMNTNLKREEAIKIWRSAKSSDLRNKVEQGLHEAQKLAKVSSEFAVMIYSAQEFGGLFVSTMEYVNGKTLDWHIANSGPDLRIQLAEIYLDSIVHTTTETTRHGDAHAKNVLVYEEHSKYETRIKLKLCDFGTSLYAGKKSSERRHWNIVKETILALTHDAPHRAFCVATLNQIWPEGLRMANSSYLARKNGVDFSDFEISLMRAAPLKDYINDLKYFSMRSPDKVRSNPN